MYKYFVFILFVLLSVLFDSRLSAAQVIFDAYIQAAEYYKEPVMIMKEVTILFSKSAIIDISFTCPDFLLPNAEKEISDISWSYSVSADSKVSCNPKQGTGNSAKITVMSRITGTYIITINATVTYKKIKFKANGVDIQSTENKTESGSTTLTLIVKRPSEIKLVDVQHVFNYSPMDMTSKWKVGVDDLLIGVDDNNKIKLKFTGLAGATYEYSISRDLTRPYTSIANDTPFEIEAIGSSEKNYQVTLKDASGNESTWKVTGFPKEWHDSRINSSGWNAWGGG